MKKGLEHKFTDKINWNKVYNEQIPLVFRSVVQSWPAVSDTERKWRNFDNLKKRVLNKQVRIEIGENYMSPDTVVVNVDFDKYIDLLNLMVDSKIKNIQKKIPKYYHAQFSLKELPEILHDVHTPDLCYTGKGHIYNTNIWLGGPYGTNSPCHFDPFQNVLCQIFGTKEVQLFSPSESKRLYPAVNTVQKNTSMVNIDDPDFLLYPSFKNIESYHCILHPGDVLFIPFKWWHYCKTNELSCSVNYWWL
jgi:lysine-specific demethylase 8